MTEIREVNIRKIKDNKGLVAVASCVVVCGEFQIYLEKIGIVSLSSGGYRLNFQWDTFGGQKVNLFYPINNYSLEILTKAIVGRYERLEEAYLKNLT